MVLLRDLCFRLGGRLSIFVLLRLALLFVCRTGSQQKKNCRHRRALPHSVLHTQFELAYKATRSARRREGNRRAKASMALAFAPHDARGFHSAASSVDA